LAHAPGSRLSLFTSRPARNAPFAATAHGRRKVGHRGNPELLRLTRWSASASITFKSTSCWAEGGIGRGVLAHDMSTGATYGGHQGADAGAGQRRETGRPELVMEAQAQACLQHPSVVNHLLHRQFPRRAPTSPMEHVPAARSPSTSSGKARCPGARRLNTSSRPRGLWPRPTDAAWSTGTSSRPTCCWARFQPVRRCTRSRWRSLACCAHRRRRRRFRGTPY